MKKIYAIVLGLAVCVAAGAQSQGFRLGQWIEIQNAILKELNRSYVDTLPVDRMQRAAIDAMLEELDPYTIYVPAEENEDLQMMVSKTYGGIGAVIYKPELDGNLFINEPYEGSPAARAGLRCGDEVLSIDGLSTVGLDSKGCSDRMKGIPGTKLILGVRKALSGEECDVTIIRESIHLPDINYSGMIAPHTGYIVQSGFTEGVSDELRESVLELKKAGMDTLVLDLRGNGGGLLREAVQIVSLFVPKGSLVVSQKGSTAQSNCAYRTYTEPVDTKMPIIVLVDSGTASASEIVSGALQDLDRATIMGHRTYGKGLVQSIVDLPYGGQLKVTTARYYTPSGRCVQAIDYSQRNEDGSVGHIPDSLTHEFSTAHGRTVRDGGGITPDHELEQKEYSDIVYTLYYKVLEPYVLDFCKKHESIAPAAEYHFDDWAGFAAFAAPLLASDAEREALAALDPAEFIPFIEEETVIRYYYQSAAYQVRVRYDDALRSALAKPLIEY